MVGERSIFFPGLVRFNPYMNSVKNVTPTTPVCCSEIDSTQAGDKDIPCNCGNKHGDEAALVAQAASGAWASKT
jgi:hypothetical protein